MIGRGGNPGRQSVARAKRGPRRAALLAVALIAAIGAVFAGSHPVAAQDPDDPAPLPELAPPAARRLLARWGLDGRLGLVTVATGSGDLVASQGDQPLDARRTAVSASDLAVAVVFDGAEGDDDAADARNAVARRLAVEFRRSGLSRSVTMWNGDSALTPDRHLGEATLRRIDTTPVDAATAGDVLAALLSTSAPVRLVVTVGDGAAVFDPTGAWPPSVAILPVPAGPDADAAEVAADAVQALDALAVWAVDVPGDQLITVELGGPEPQRHVIDPVDLGLVTAAPPPDRSGSVVTAAPSSTSDISAFAGAADLDPTASTGGGSSFLLPVLALAAVVAAAVAIRLWVLPRRPDTEPALTTTVGAWWSEDDHAANGSESHDLGRVFAPDLDDRDG